VSVGEEAVIERSVVLAGARIGAASHLRDAIIAPHARVGEDCLIELGVVGEGVVVEPGSKPPPGARIFPDVMSEQ
jgi:glucose-1-phosphate adenylyltransferase